MIIHLFKKLFFIHFTSLLIIISLYYIKRDIIIRDVYSRLVNIDFPLLQFYNDYLYDNGYARLTTNNNECIISRSLTYSCLDNKKGFGGNISKKKMLNQKKNGLQNIFIKQLSLERYN